MSEMTHAQRKPIGGPATKFVYFLIKSHHPIDQSELIRISDLPRRTIQGVIEELKRQGLIIESAGTDDARKKFYDLVPGHE
jgi:phosphosulfolactate synthase